MTYTSPRACRGGKSVKCHPECYLNATIGRCAQNGSNSFCVRNERSRSSLRLCCPGANTPEKRAASGQPAPPHAHHLTRPLRNRRMSSDEDDPHPLGANDFDDAFESSEVSSDTESDDGRRQEQLLKRSIKGGKKTRRMLRAVSKAMKASSSEIQVEIGAVRSSVAGQTPVLADVNRKLGEGGSSKGPAETDRKSRKVSAIHLPLRSERPAPRPTLTSRTHNPFGWTVRRSTRGRRTRPWWQCGAPQLMTSRARTASPPAEHSLSRRPSRSFSSTRSTRTAFRRRCSTRSAGG